jgi:hypothetical protein
MDTLMLVFLGAALGASILVLAVTLLALVVLRRASLGRVRASGKLRLPGAAWQGEIEASSQK